MSPNPELGKSNSSRNKGKERERSFDETRPDGGRRSSEEREPLDPVRHTKDNSSISEKVNGRQSKIDDRYIDKLFNYMDSLDGKPPNPKTLSRLHKEWEINQSRAEPKSQVEEPSKIRELNDNHFSKTSEVDDYYIDRLTYYIDNLRGKESNQKILNDFSAKWKDSQAGLQEKHDSQMRQLEGKPDIPPKERSDFLDSSHSSGLIPRSNSQKWLRDRFGYPQQENVDTSNSTTMSRKGKETAYDSEGEESHSIHKEMSSSNPEINIGQEDLHPFSHMRQDERSAQEIVESHVTGELGNTIEAVDLMKARSVEAAKKLRDSGNTLEANKLMDSIEIIASEKLKGEIHTESSFSWSGPLASASAIRPSEVMQPQRDVEPDPAPDLYRQLRSLEQNHYRLVNNKQIDQSKEWRDSFAALKGIHDKEWNASRGIKGTLKEFVGKGESLDQITKRQQAEREKLKIDLQEKHRQEIRTLKERYNDGILEIIKIASPPPPYNG